MPGFDPGTEYEAETGRDSLEVVWTWLVARKSTEC